MTDITPAKTIIKVQGQQVSYEEMTDNEVDSALPHMPPTQQRILALAGRGLSNREICAQLAIKAETLIRYKKQKLFHDMFYTMAQIPFAITIATVKKIALADALDSYLHIRSLSVVPPEATAAEKRVALSANETVLKMAGVFEEPGIKQEINIGQLLVRLSQNDTNTKRQWER